MSESKQVLDVLNFYMNHLGLTKIEWLTFLEKTELT